jgi:hypothetical protein
MADVTIFGLSNLTAVSDLLIPASTANGSSTGKVSIASISGLAPVQSVAAKTGAVVLTKTDVGLNLVENKSSATIRGEITSDNVTIALGYTPYNNTNPSGFITANVTGTLTTDYLSVRKQNDAGEGGEIQLQGSGGFGGFQIDNLAGNCRIHTLAAGKNFVVVGGGIYAEGPLTGSITTQTPGMAKAWVNWNGANANGTNSPIAGSYNISSVYKNGNGDYTINFSNAISGFAWSGSTGGATATDQSLRGLWEVNRTTTSLRVRVQAVNSGAQAPESNGVNSVIIFGA